MLSPRERLHADLVLVIDVQQMRDDAGDTTRRRRLSTDEKEWTSASAKATTGVQKTHGQIAPLRAILKNPEAPVFDKTGHLVSRGVVRPKAVFCGQTRFLRAERNNILLFAGFQQIVCLGTHGKSTYLANPLGVVE